MDQATTKTFHIYRSSAGSGKTRTLAKEYLVLALRVPEYFRYILAMTFTNKSTQEMKDRIIHYLDDFTKGKSEDLASEILQRFADEGKPFTQDELSLRSQEVLSRILHQYSQFSISTIDAFFQRVIRSFTRETGLLGNFKLEVDNDMVLAEVVDLLMDKITDDENLREWITDYSVEKLLEGKDWDIRRALIDFSREIFREEFKAIEDDVLNATEDKAFFLTFKERLREEVVAFRKKTVGEARKLMDDFHRHDLSISDFKHGKNGSVYSYVAKLAGSPKDIELPQGRTRLTIETLSEWPSKSPNARVIANLAPEWHVRLNELIGFIEENTERYLSAQQAFRNLYVFGLVSDISKTLKEYLADNNTMLLSDAPRFLQGVMQGQDTSFIYEKVGSFYRHFLIDEFQDTSSLQWANLLPLIKNGIAQNYSSMIVGDIKQSIYRWRGGDLKILQERVKTEVGPEQVAPFTLNTNYRSTGNLVEFNNVLFAAAAQVISLETDTAFPLEAYEDAPQKVFRESNKGYAEIRYFEADEAVDNEKLSFEDQSLQRLPYVIEQLQEKGIALYDIAFLVRNNQEGHLIAQHFMQYRKSPDAKSQYRYDVVSNESLRLDQASSVLVLVNAMRLLEDPNNQIARAHLAYEHDKLWNKNMFPNPHKVFTQSKTNAFAKLMPPAFMKQRDQLAALPLAEMFENLVQIFSLNNLDTEIAYLQGFHDVVLEFTAREKNDLTAFLQWWEDNKKKKSIQVASDVDAAQIITIHKAKGLQFKYVIVPFLTWELNHSFSPPILWCHSDDELFRDAGYIPLRYASTLKDTFFREAYSEERKRIYLDNLNLLYVAFTRAEEGLIAHAPLPLRPNISNVGQLVKRVIESNETFQGFWSEEHHTLTIGTISAPEKKGRRANSLTLKKYPVTPWRERLYVRTQGKEFFHVTEQRKKINYGIFIHTLMSRIRYASMAEAVVEQSAREGLIRPDERGIIWDTISWIINHPELKIAYQEGNKVKMEASLLVPDGGERRIDRLTITPTHAILIDYKTGVPTGSDETQIKEYLHILGNMGTMKTRAFLVYPADKRVIEITL